MYVTLIMDCDENKTVSNVAMSLALSLKTVGLIDIVEVLCLNA